MIHFSAKTYRSVLACPSRERLDNFRNRENEPGVGKTMKVRTVRIALTI